MASPSKTLPAAQDPLPSSSNPLTSPNPFDSIDAFLNLEKIVSRENSPLSNKKKRNREEADMSDCDVPQLRCRSTRNPRIGSGFNNKPNNPVQIIDEEDGVDVEVEEEGNAPVVVIPGVHEDLLPSFLDSGIIPDSL